MKIIVLILAHDQGHYLTMQRLWLKYMTLHPGVECFFVKSQPTGPTFISEDTHTIYVTGPESIHPGGLIKTVGAIEAVLDRSFDYLVRTNLSSVWDFRKMEQFLLHFQPETAAVWTEFFFLSGAGYIINRKWCKFIVQNKNKIDYSQLDDVAISAMMAEHSPPKIDFPRYDCTEEDLDRISEDLVNGWIFHYRCRMNNPEMSIAVMARLIDKIYTHT